MRKDDLKSIQGKELEMLLYFQKICSEHNLRFYLCGGALIGAIRHKGFIPWDDDIDLFMPRPKVYHDAGASIRDNYTTFINRHSINDDICHGLALEIMPIDGCPKGKITRIIQIADAMIFALFNAQRIPNNKGWILKLLAKIIYKLIPSKKLRYYIWKKAEKRMTKYKWEDCNEVTDIKASKS